MGLHDAEEMLAAAQAQSVIDERLIAIQQAKLTAIRDLCDHEDTRWDGLVGAVGTTIPTRDLRKILDGTA